MDTAESVQLRAGRDVRIELQEMQLFFTVFRMDGGKQHPAGFDAHHGTRGKVHDRNAGLADELFRLVERVYAGKDRALRARAVVQRELQKLLALRDGFAGKHLDRAEIAFAECLKIDEIREQRFDRDVGEVDFLFGGSRMRRFLRSLARLLGGAGIAGTLKIGGQFRFLALLNSLRLHGRDIEATIGRHSFTSYKLLYT